MIKRILVPLDNSNYTDIALEYAGMIAKKHKAVVNGISILDIQGIEDSIGLVPIGNQYWADKLEESKINEANELINNLKKKFEEKLKKENVQFYFNAYDLQDVKFIHTEKNIKDILNEKYLGWADLIVLGAHSKNVIQDFFIGSLTSFLIDLNKKPLFIGF